MNWRISVATGLAVGLGGLAFLIAPSPTDARPLASATATKRAQPKLLLQGSGGGGKQVPGVQDDRISNEGIPGASCHYENPLVIGPGPLISQKDPDGQFYAELADDFVLVDPDDPDGLNGCVLDTYAKTGTNCNAVHLEFFCISL